MSEPNSSMSSQKSPTDPDYIKYLLDPEQEYNCYFVVGNPSLDIPTERIGVVKKMLLAHSVVLRAQLQDSKLAEKDDVRLIDVYPDTFKNMLRYTYGYDNTTVLTFEEADNLLYAAEKYMIVSLKNKLASRLMSLLNCDNICSLMNNPACYTILELNSAITEILQCETERVLTNPQFLNLSPEAFLRILEQEVLDADEIEIWRSAIKWAKNRAGSEDGSVLRNELSGQLQKIRICSLPYEELCTEVFTTSVLNIDEINLVCQSRKSEETQQSLTTVCNIVEERSKPLVKSDILIADFAGEYPLYEGMVLTESVMTLDTKDSYVEICRVEFSNYEPTTHRCSGTITFDNNCGSLITVPFNEQLDTTTTWCIPTGNKSMKVRLTSHKSYSLRTTFSCGSSHVSLYSSSSRGFYQSSFANKHMSVTYHKDNSRYPVFHITKIMYRTMTKKVK